MKKAEHDATGGEHVSDAVEMAGWGVEEAEKKHKAEASMSPPIPDLFLFYSQQNNTSHTFAPCIKLHHRLSNVSYRSGNATGPSVRNPQVLHLHPSTPHSSADAQGRPGAPRLGLEHREAHDQGGSSDQPGCDGGEEAIGKKKPRS